MVTSHPNSINKNQDQDQQAVRPRFIYITGCDGTGKTTQARRLLSHLAACGEQPQHLWLRFPFFFSLPLLAYARLRGYSWYEERDEVRQGYWDFRNSWLLRTWLPWVLLIDAALAAIAKIYLPLRLQGKTIVCERFALDMLVDLSLALDDFELHRRLPGRLYRHLIPKEALIIILELDAATIRARRADLEIDRLLSARLKAFRNLVTDYGLTVLSSKKPIAELSQSIQEMMSKTNET
jgi:thymidylate kinase